MFFILITIISAFTFRILLSMWMMKSVEYCHCRHVTLTVHLKVISVCFVHAPLMATLPLCIETALVVDVGYNETSISAVDNAFPVVKSFTLFPNAAKAIHQFVPSHYLSPLFLLILIHMFQTINPSVPIYVPHYQEICPHRFISLTFYLLSFSVVMLVVPPLMV